MSKLSSPIGMERLDFGATESQLSSRIAFQPNAIDVVGQPRICVSPGSDVASELQGIYRELDADIFTLQQEGKRTKPERLQVRTTLLILEEILDKGEVTYLDALETAKTAANDRSSEYHQEARFTHATENSHSENPRTMTAVVVDHATLAFATISYATHHLQKQESPSHNT